MEENMDLPPRFIMGFFRWFCDPGLQHYIEGDLIELYRERKMELGKRKADWIFLWDVLLLLRPGIIRPLGNFSYLNETVMFRNYFKIGLRNMLKYKVFSFINVFGLALAMSVCMLILLMLADQNRYDQFHTKKDRIYRILSDYEGSKQPYDTTPEPLAKALLADYPIVEASTSLSPGVGGDVSYAGSVAEMRGYFTDEAFLSLFDFELVAGDAGTALSQPYSMIISKTMAVQLFGEEDPLGKAVEFEDRKLPFPSWGEGGGDTAVAWGDFTVTGVIDDTPSSHLTFDVLMSASTVPSLIATDKLEDKTEDWKWYFRTYTYVLLDGKSGKEDLTAALTDLVDRKEAEISSEYTKGFKLVAQPLGEVALGLSGNDTNNRMPLVGYYFLAVLALVIMGSACMNYTNLSIARAMTRAKEIGIRKVTGAIRRNLVLQFLSESVLTALLAMVVAVLLLLLLIPGFKGLWVNQYLNFELPFIPSIYLGFIGFAIGIGLVAGIYPALILSGYQPIKVLKSLPETGSHKMGLRKALGVSQFVVSLFFITTSILIYNQFRHFLTFDYGFQTENIVNVSLQGMDYEKLAGELSQVPGVVAISACDIIPSTGTSNTNEIRRPGEEEYRRVGILHTDRFFVQNLGIEPVAGRSFPEESEAAHSQILVNEAMVKSLGYSSPSELIGETFETKYGAEMVVVIGVVKDFRYKLLINQDEIEPLMMRYQPAQFQYLNVKIASPDPMAAIDQLRAKWEALDPVHPFEYRFMDEQLEATHHGVFDVVSILGYISFLAVVIACLGLLGMATYTAERRTKEVGIRKFLGAGDWSITLLLSRGFLQMLALSIVIGAPLSYFVNNLWLQNFPNRVGFGVGTVMLGVLMLLLLGMLTVGSQTVRASRMKGVDSLKME